MERRCAGGGTLQGSPAEAVRRVARQGANTAFSSCTLHREETLLEPSQLSCDHTPADLIAAPSVPLFQSL